MEDKNIFNAYVDGSFLKGITSYACIILDKNKKEIIFENSDIITTNDVIKMRQIVGEIQGAISVMTYCIEHKMPCINIYYDYIGIENWARCKWKTNNKFTQAYQLFCLEYFSRGFSINYIKVKSHSGDKWNDYVDHLAKNAIYNFFGC